MSLKVLELATSAVLIQNYRKQSTLTSIILLKLKVLN